MPHPSRGMFLPLLFCTASFGSAFEIFPLNIFNNDAQTRRLAAPNDLRWTVRVRGCTGAMLSTRYVMTAAHCSPRVGDRYTSGGCLELGCQNDLAVTAIAANLSSFDTAIVEVSWNRVDSRWRQRYTPRIQVRSDELVLGRDGQASELFTVGFPVDKGQRPMYATGFAKRAQGNHLQYNVPSINGNSGGAVWKLDDYTLVSQTNHGPQAFGQQGWNNRDPEDSRAWNGGPQMHLVYAASSLLRSLFPQGRNPNVSFEGYLLYDDVLPPMDP